MKKICLWFGLLLFPLATFAAVENDASKEINLIFDDRNMTLNFKAQPELLRWEPQHFIQMGSLRIPMDLNGALVKEKNDLFEIETVFQTKISPTGLHNFLNDALAIDGVKNSAVVIDRNEYNEIIFDGTPLEGPQIDEEKLIQLLEKSRKTGKKNVRVPSQKIFSEVIVADLQLKGRGVQEIIAIGKSNFTGSSDQRRQNIRAAARKFNGKVIKQNENFSFNHTLKNVSEKDGFVRELVILGNDLKKELGGGTCQVSTTLFRAAYFGGLPILDRRSHSYTVPYYKPIGLDATIYLGGQDLVVKNNTPGDILVQAFVEGDNLFFTFYGTHDQRKVVTEGPFISKITPPSDGPRVTMTDSLAPGQTKWISDAHNGLRAEWKREITYQDGTISEDLLESDYRPWRAQILKGRPRDTFARGGQLAN